jgi:peptidylprolyl isomerase
LDGKHVVFGEVTSGMDVLAEVEKLGSQSGRTKGDIRIGKCGLIENT